MILCRQLSFIDGAVGARPVNYGPVDALVEKLYSTGLP